MDGRPENCGALQAQLCSVAFLSKLTVGHRLSQVARNIVMAGPMRIFITSLHKSLGRKKENHKNLSTVTLIF